MQLPISESKTDISLSDINTLTEKVGWGNKYYKTEEQWQHTLAMSSYIAYIKDKGKLISFARILEDGKMCMFYDVCVHPDYQKKQVGTRVMNHLIDKIKDKNYVSVDIYIAAVLN